MAETVPSPVAPDVPSEGRPRPPYGLLLGVVLAELALSLLARAGSMLLDRLSPSLDVMFYFRAQEFAFWATGAAVLAAVALVWARLPRSRPRRFAGAATVLFALVTGLWGLMVVPEVLGGERPFGDSPIQSWLAVLLFLLATAGDLALFVGLTLRSRALGIRADGGAVIAFVVVRLVRSGLMVVRFAIPASARPDFFHDPAMVIAMSLGQLALFAAGVALLSALLIRLRAAPEAIGEHVAPEAAAAAPDSPERDLLIGILALGAGLLVTAVSYAAASSAGGGSYVVTTGLIVYGLFRIGRAAFRRGGDSGAPGGGERSDG